jgi:hypothetical protein
MGRGIANPIGNSPNSGAILCESVCFVVDHILIDFPAYHLAQFHRRAASRGSIDAAAAVLLVLALLAFALSQWSGNAVDLFGMPSFWDK